MTSLELPAERAGSTRRLHEALDHFIVFGQELFDHIVTEYVAYYHEHGLHQGVGNALLTRWHTQVGEATGDTNDAAEPLSLADIKCETRLGGLLKHFYRQAA